MRPPFFFFFNEKEKRAASRAQRGTGQGIVQRDVSHPKGSLVKGSWHLRSKWLRDSSKSDIGSACIDDESPLIFGYAMKIFPPFDKGGFWPYIAQLLIVNC